MYVDVPLFVFVFQAQDRIGKLQDIYCKYLLSYDLLPKVTSLFVYTTSTTRTLPYVQELLLADVARVCVCLCYQEEKDQLLREVQSEKENCTTCGMSVTGI